jgi:putative toxin-antitoxin system antitoxin component (TIGR02293 family)
MVAKQKPAPSPKRYTRSSATSTPMPSPPGPTKDGRSAERRVPVRALPAEKAAVLDVEATSTSPVALAFAGDTADVIARMRSGTPARTIPRIASTLGISQDKLFELLDLPKSTVKGRISANGMLSSTEQDRVYRAEKALARAIQVLEDEEAARTWLSRENRSLGGEIPLALLDTEPGYELVLDTLGQIEYGVVS